MKKTKFYHIINLLIVYSLLNFPAILYSQGVAINTTGATADPSAQLDITSTSKGVLISRISTAQRDAIASPAQGLLIYNTTTKCVEFYDNSSWYTLGCTCTVPDIPVATAGSGATETQITANWNAATGAASYSLDVSTVSDFSSFVTGYNDLNVGTVTTYDVTGLTCNTTYYYRIRAVNSCGTTGSSNTITYTTAVCFACGSPFTDSRDSKSYNTVLIGSQCWMAQELDYGTYVTAATGQGAAGTQKYCYNNNVANCTTYGGLYEWAEMMNGAASSNASPSGVQGICPTGWHIPSDAEWCTLENTVEAGTDPGCNLTGARGTATGGKMKETGTTHWNAPNTGATNSSGFTALPGGRTWAGASSNLGAVGYYWSSREWDANTGWYRGLGSNTAQIADRGGDNKLLGHSVRCVKD